MTSQDSENSEYYIQFIAESTTPKAMTLQQIREATQNDSTLQHAAHIIQKDLWHT
jgi:CRISPR/Cas system-associated endonuclease Cas1